MKYAISITWTQDDVLHTANEMGVTLTDQEVRNVLDHIEYNHDANYGISWDTIQFAIELILRPLK